MTLCIAWRENGNIHLSSDSRITLKENSTTNVGIKVISFPVAIYPPLDSTDRSKIRKPDIEMEYGMCVAGSQVNSHLIKESITEILQHVQYIPGLTEISMDQIAKLIFKVYRETSRAVCSTAIAQNGIADIVIAGFCPKQRRVRAFQFNTEKQTNTHSYDEVLKNDGDYLLSGSGSSVAQSILDSTGNAYKSSWGYLRLLKRIIDEAKTDSVGGNVQYGNFDNNHNFKIYGVFDRSDNKTRVMLRGLDMDDEDFNSDDPHSLIISYSVVDIQPPGSNV